MKSIRKKIYGGWNKKNATLNIILDYKNNNKKMRIKFDKTKIWIRMKSKEKSNSLNYFKKNYNQKNKDWIKKK
jgi:hypothetical protein